MTLLTIVQKACNELAIPAPTQVVGNVDQQVTQLLALANREGEEYAAQGGQWSGWPELRKEYTFNLVPVGPYTGDTTNRSTILTNMSSTVGLDSTYGVSGNGLLTGAQVVSTTSTTVTLNTPANSDGTAQSFQFGQISYALPSDIQDFISASFWDRNFRWQMLGPLSAQEWQTIVSGISPVGPRIRYRIMADRFWIQPPPGEDQTDLIAYEYISKNWCQSASGTAQSEWTADTDTFLWPDRTMILGIKWRFLRAKGLDYSEELRTYQNAVDRQIARSGANRALPMNASAHGLRLLSSMNVPDTGFGT